MPSAAFAALAAVVDEIAQRAVGGDAKALRRAVADLGQGAEGRGRETGAGDGLLRVLLLGVAADPETPAAAARFAERTADAVMAQALVPPATAAGQDAAAQSAYLQMPLPGGQSAEVRVLPDRHGGGPDRGERQSVRVAFLLSMSALGQLVVEATVGPNGTEAVVRAASDDATSFLGGLAPDLADALARARGGDGSASVNVERAVAPPQRMLPGPPPSGLDLIA